MSSASFTTEEILRATKARHRPSPEGGGSAGEQGPAARTGAERRAARCSSVSTDSRALSSGALFVALTGPRFDGHAFLRQAAESGAFGAVVRKGAPEIADVEGKLDLFEVEDTLVALGALARHHRDRHPKLKTAAVTGSNGKTTTKELFAAALSLRGTGLWTRGNLNNRIGVPLTLFGLNKGHRWAVVEMGMNEPGEIAMLTAMARPSLGLITTASEVHLSGLGSVDAVAKAKAELYHGLPDGAVAVVNLDDPRLPALAEAAGALEAGGRLRRITYGTHPRADVRLGHVMVEAGGPEGEGGLLGCGLRFQVLVSPALLDECSRAKVAGEGRGHLILDVRLALLGRHNAHNACGALAAAMAMGIEPKAAAEALEKVPPLPRRLEPKPGPRGSLVLDDCYNAGPPSVLAALETGAELAEGRGGRLLVVLGDMFELGEREIDLHREMGRAAAAAGASLLFTMGERSKATAEAAGEAGLAEVVHEDDHEALVERLQRLLGPKDVVLLKGSRGAAMERVCDPLVEAARGSADEEAAR